MGYGSDDDEAMKLQHNNAVVEVIFGPEQAQ